MRGACRARAKRSHTFACATVPPFLSPSTAVGPQQLTAYLIDAHRLHSYAYRSVQIKGDHTRSPFASSPVARNFDHYCGCATLRPVASHNLCGRCDKGKQTSPVAVMVGDPNGVGCLEQKKLAAGCSLAVNARKSDAAVRSLHPLLTREVRNVLLVNLWGEKKPSLKKYAQALQSCLHDASNPYADWYFGGREAAATLIGEWSERPSSELYIGRSIVMLDNDDHAIGAVIGMSGAELAACRAADFAAFCEELGDNPAADEVIEQAVRVSRALFRAVPDDVFYISRVAIERSWRGRGLARRILTQLIELKRQEGFRRFVLDVSNDNLQAIRLYESLGMRVAESKRVRDVPFEYCEVSLDVGPPGG